jgi:hypothetical protein
MVLWQYKGKQELLLLLLLHPSILQLYNRHKKLNSKFRRKRRNHTPIHDNNTQLLPHVIRELHHHPTEIREIMPGKPHLATQVEEGKWWSQNPKT